MGVTAVFLIIFVGNAVANIYPLSISIMKNRYLPSILSGALISVCATLLAILFGSGTNVTENSVRTPVFCGGDYGSKFYRIPAIVTAVDGTLVAVADKRVESNADLPGVIDIVARRSSDGGRTWGEYITVAAHDSIGGCGDAALVVDRTTGDILAIYSHGNGLWQDSPARITVIRSHDNGLTWGDTLNINPQILTTDPDGTQPLKLTSAFATSGRALQLADGRIIFALVTRNKGSRDFPVYAVFSDDGGYTWQVARLPATTQGDESKIVELADGTLIMSIRNKYKARLADNRRIFARSTDRGATWSEPYGVYDLPDPACNGDIIRYGNSDIVLQSLPASFNSRDSVSIYVSFDGGNTFPCRKLICEGPSAYSSMTELPDGKIGILTEEARDDQPGVYDIWFTAVNPEDLGIK